MKKNIVLLVLLALMAFPALLRGQNAVGGGTISGDFSFNGMFYIPDSLIGAEEVDSKVRANTWLNLNYQNGGFSAGARYEFYSFPLIDFENINYKGQGLSYFYADYRNDIIQVTAGNFYEQFGQGFTLRAFEDRQLGIDNSILGARIRVNPYKGIYLKGVWGIQRNNFDFNYSERNDYVRGLDGEIAFADMFEKIAAKNITFTIGGSFVSKYETSESDFYFPITIDTMPGQGLIAADHFPENVSTWSSRMNMGWKGIRFEGEYARKINDPNLSNNYIYKDGEALFLSLSYSRKGFGVSGSILRADNMDFRSQRDANPTYSTFSINNIPAINRQYSYQLIGNYSYASQPNGQIGFQGQINYQIPKKTKLGGRYGTDITVSYARFHDINRTTDPLADSIGTPTGTEGYSSKFFDFGGDLYFQDLGFDITRRVHKNWKVMLLYNYINYDFALQGYPGQEMLKGHHVGGEVTWKIGKGHALRFENQYLFTKQDMGSWLYALIEYSIAPNWFFSVADQWNYNNADPAQRIHYYNMSIAYVWKTTRIALNYGKTREGILCIGGVCRTVPASYGIGLNVTTKF